MNDRVKVTCPVRGTYHICKQGPPNTPIMWRASIGRIYKDVGPYQTWFNARNEARIFFGDRPDLTIKPAPELESVSTIVREQQMVEEAEANGLVE